MNDTAPRLELIWAALTAGISPVFRVEKALVNKKKTQKLRDKRVRTGFNPSNMSDASLQLRNARIQTQIRLGMNGLKN